MVLSLQRGLHVYMYTKCTHRHMQFSRERDLEGNVSVLEVSVVQHVQRAFLYGLQCREKDGINVRNEGEACTQTSGFVAENRETWNIIILRAADFR